MKMKKLIVLSIVCAAVVVACGKKIMPESGTNNSSKSANNNSATSASQSANTNRTDTTPSMMTTKGLQTVVVDNVLKAVSMDAEKTLYVTKCKSCHALKNPNDYTVAQMTNILKVELPKAKLSEEEEEKITNYLLANAKQ